MAQGKLYIIAAPSGAGKTSLVGALLEKMDNLEVSISHTTRSSRPGEEDGKNYFFVNEVQFQEMCEQHLFLEHAMVYGHYYGTSKEWVDNKLSKGVDIILEIDWQGAQQIKKLLPDCLSIFILPPAKEALRQRLIKRGQDEAEVIEARMQKAQEEISHFDEYDYLVVNDEFQVALEDLAAIIGSQRLLLQQQRQRHRGLLQELLSH